MSRQLTGSSPHSPAASATDAGTGTMNSLFYKLRRKRVEADYASAGFTKPMATAPPPCSPNRASYYFPSKDRVLPPRLVTDNPKLRDTHFPRSPQHSDIVFDVVARRADRMDKVMPELKLRPILTKPAARANGAEASDSSAAASPTARVRRFHARAPSGRRKVATLPADTCRRRRRRATQRWLYESLVVVKESTEPEEDFLESMAEMIAANDVRSPRGLEDLLACYLALNAADHHHAIVAAFRRAWLHCVPPPPPRERCMHD
ncbi:transcription repressor OFP3-like [Phragmites australis]|uniref:transcription repressor OFP3-like n=1 Tax=Phragmites australis TaxID=29695 RepID=UPI002D77ED7D|nr:transcription repressor OFP3-like [Phragmites australis]